MLKSLKNKAGYVSIETIIVAGLMLALGAFALDQLFDAGTLATTNAIGNLNEAVALADTLGV